MEIGSKLKAARLGAPLTQEQVAEKLGVSRQTISNWENGKTYPDIVSVVKMSDLYRISLDDLLKEGQPMTSYLDYLEESTNIVKSNDRKAKAIIVSAYLAIWTFAILVFWFFTSGSNAGGYSFVFLWILLPVATFCFSLLIGKNHYWGNRKWFSAIAFGALYMLAEYATFCAANMVSFSQFHLPRFEMWAAGIGISAVGIAVGCAARQMQLHRKKRDASAS